MNNGKSDKYDALRKCIPCILPPDRLLLSCGVNALGPDAVAEILGNVRDFNRFTPENDPYSEHDFGSFMQDGHKIFWKIDYCKVTDGLGLTVMLAEE